MITAAALRQYTCKDLAQMAKQRGIPGWHAMRKDQLIHALVRKAKAKGTSKSKSGGRRGGGVRSAGSRGSGARSGGARSSGARSGGAGATTSASKNGSAKALPTARSASKRRGATSSSVSAGSRRRGSTSVGKTTTARNSRSASRGASSAGGGAAAKVHTNGKAKPKRTTRRPAKPPTDPKVIRKIHAAHQQREEKKDLTSRPVIRTTNGTAVPLTHSAHKDRIVLMVRDPYWLHAYWEISSNSISRAKAAMAEQWHTARPVLRLIEVKTGSTTATAERVVRDIPIHGGVQNWYIDVADPPHGYRVEIGYLATGARFHAIARSNTVQTPRPGSQDVFDTNWDDVSENCERIFALSGGYDPDNSTGELQEVFEERFQRPMGRPLSARFGGGAELSLGRSREFNLDVDAEMVIHGRTEPESHVTLAGEPVKLRTDGTFSVRVHLPDRRQVLPVVGSSSDGMEQRTVVLAVERNTKVMEPVLRDSVND